ncbi:hypothetical protein V6N13_042535 [Hibiscus sabdariffa]
MLFSSYFALLLLPLRSPVPCSQNLVRNLFVCWLGCLVFPSKDIVSFFSGGLARFGREGWWRCCRGRNSEGGSSAMYWRVMGSSHVLDFRHLPTTKGSSWAINNGPSSKMRANGLGSEREGFTKMSRSRAGIAMGLGLD